MSIIMIVNVDFIYPIGSIYLSAKATNPGTIFGGTWVQLTGRYLFATTTTVGDQGQAAMSIYTGAGTQNHTLTIEQIPGHNHGMQVAGTKLNTEGNTIGFRANTQAGSGDFWNMSLQRTNGGSHNGSITDTGGNQGHNHNIAYIPVYCWQRTA